MEYHKIQSVYKRDEKTHKFIEGQFSLPEFEYLKDCKWVWTEKIDGTNIRVSWNDGKIKLDGKTDNAQIPAFLYRRLTELFTPDKLQAVFPDGGVILYGEGYGAKIQKGGGNYIPDGVDFILFDVNIGGWWLKREDVDDIAKTLEILSVPVTGRDTLKTAIEVVRSGIPSLIGKCEAEGLVLRPEVELKDRHGHRIITKIKTKDFLEVEHEEA